MLVFSSPTFVTTNHSNFADLEDPSPNISTLYDLAANITHSSSAGTAREDTTWKCHIHTRSKKENDEKWFQIQDLIVEEINKQIIFLGQTYIQVSLPLLFE